MKKLIFALVIAWAFAGLAPAEAYVTPVKSERGRAILQKMGGDLVNIAARFGCPEFAWANFIDEGRVAAFVYVPAGADFKKAPRKVSVAIHALEGDAAKDKTALAALATSLQGRYKQSGKIIKNEPFYNAKGEPGFFMEYTIGEGAAKEHNAGVFMRLTSHTAAFVQIQQTGKPLAAEDSAKMKSFLVGNDTKTAKPTAAAKKG